MSVEMVDTDYWKAIHHIGTKMAGKNDKKDLRVYSFGTAVPFCLHNNNFKKYVGNKGIILFTCLRVESIFPEEGSLSSKRFLLFSL